MDVAKNPFEKQIVRNADGSVTVTLAKPIQAEGSDAVLLATMTLRKAVWGDLKVLDDYPGDHQGTIAMAAHLSGQALPMLSKLSMTDGRVVAYAVNLQLQGN